VNVVYPETVTVFTETADQRGNRTPDDGTVVEGCVSWETGGATGRLFGGTEVAGAGADTLTWDRTCVMPPGTVISSTDRVLMPDGLMYEVVSEPIVWTSALTSRQPGVEVHLRRVQG
jgi:hypothetical protein